LGQGQGKKFKGFCSEEIKKIHSMIESGDFLQRMEKVADALQ